MLMFYKISCIIKAAQIYGQLFGAAKDLVRHKCCTHFICIQYLIVHGNYDIPRYENVLKYCMLECNVRY